MRWVDAAVRFDCEVRDANSSSDEPKRQKDADRAAKASAQFLALCEFLTTFAKARPVLALTLALLLSLT